MYDCCWVLLAFDCCFLMLECTYQRKTHSQTAVVRKPPAFLFSAFCTVRMYSILTTRQNLVFAFAGLLEW